MDQNLMNEDRSGLERYYSSSGIYDFFVKLAHGTNYPAKLVMAVFFSIFLIVPLLGGPNASTTGSLNRPPLSQD